VTAARIPAVQLLRHAVLVCLCAAVHAAAPKTGTLQNTNQGLRPLGNGSFELGTVRLNKNTRSVTFPAAVNLVADLAVEYVVVHKTGKGHESIFTTTARPQDIHLALLLLDARPVMTNAFPQDLAIPPGGERVTIEVTWKKDGRETRRAAEQLVLERPTGRPLARGEWIFNGSNFSEGMFTAQRDGSIVSIHIDPDALVNNPRRGRDNDDRHVPNTAELPAVGTPVEITIRIGTPPKTP
jgi:hypothetical protein